MGGYIYYYFNRSVIDIVKYLPSHEDKICVLHFFIVKTVRIEGLGKLIE